MDVSFKDYISTFAQEEEFSQKPYAKFYSQAIDKHSQQMLTQISMSHHQKQKIINHLRLSEDEIPLPLQNPLKLGELLQREKKGGGTVIGGASLSPRFGGGNGSPLKNSEKKVSGFENEALRFIPTNEDIIKTETSE